VMPAPDPLHATKPANLVQARVDIKNIWDSQGLRKTSIAPQFTVFIELCQCGIRSETERRKYCAWVWTVQQHVDGRAA
jgi:hypothetical protein